MRNGERAKKESPANSLAIFLRFFVRNSRTLTDSK